MTKGKSALKSGIPYAVMCELRAFAGEYPTNSPKYIGMRRPDPVALQYRRVHQRPISVRGPTSSDFPPDKHEYAASIQDLIDMGLLVIGKIEGQKGYFSQLTKKAMQYLK